MIQQIYSCIEKESANHSIKELCDVYEVSRSGYYKWLKRKGTLNRYELQQKELDYYVADIHSHFPSQGYRAIADTLLNMYGWIVSDISVWRSMRRLGISGYIRRKQKSPETKVSRPSAVHRGLDRRAKRRGSGNTIEK